MTIIDKIEAYVKNRVDIFGNGVFAEKNLILELKNTKIEIQNTVIPKDATNNVFETPSNNPVNSLTVDPSWAESKSLQELKSKIQNCQECELGATRTNFVFGEGNPNADIMIIGEAPGKDEDLKGEPFVGRAGQLLTKILEAIEINREDVFIANIIKSRPPDNRRPSKDEVAKCKPYLMKQIELIKPKFIISLGLTSIESLMNSSYKMADIRGEFMDFNGIKLMVTYHPAALLRNPNWKKPVWEDMKKFKAEYDKFLKERA